MIVGNVRGLRLGQTHCKMEYMSNLADENDSVVISLTENHLCEDIIDGEVSIKGWSHVIE